MKKVLWGVILMAGCVAGTGHFAPPEVEVAALTGAAPAPFVGLRQGVSGPPVGQIFTGPTGKKEMNGVFFDYTWQKFGGAWAAIQNAQTPQAYEDAVNAHPRAGGIIHHVKNNFHHGVPDCSYADTTSGKPNFQSVAIWVDGVNHANDRVYAVMPYASGQWSLRAFDDTCTDKWTSGNEVDLGGAWAEGGLTGDAANTYINFVTVDSGNGSVLYSINASNGTLNWSDNNINNGAHWNAPWADASSAGHVWLAEAQGDVSSRSASTGAVAWSKTNGGGNAVDGQTLIHSQAVELNGFLYFANDNGWQWILDSSNGTTVAKTCMSMGGSCPGLATDAVWASPVFDGGANGSQYYWTNGYKLFSYTTNTTNGCNRSGGAGTACTQFHSPLSPGATTGVLQASSPATDGTYVFMALKGKLYRYAKNMASAANSVTMQSHMMGVSGSCNITAAALEPGKNVPQTFSNPMSSPTPIGNYTFGGTSHNAVVIGDGNGCENMAFSDASFTFHSANDTFGSNVCTATDGLGFIGATGATKWMYFVCTTGSAGSALMQVDPATM